MARKKKSGSDQTVGVLAVLGLALLVVLSKPLLLLLVGAVVAGIWYLLSKGSKGSASSAKNVTRPESAPGPNWHRPTEPVRITTPPQRVSASTDVPITVEVQLSGGAAPSSYRLPDAPPEYGEGKWIPAGESVTVAGITIPGGLVYVGTKLLAKNGLNDPCLIDPSKQVAHNGDFTERQMGYWPSYASITPHARRAYLNWLAGGRLDADADIGFVFLFFYGLERRVLLDSAKDAAARADWHGIEAELLRLIALYGDQSGSFKGYASSLLGWMAQAHIQEKTYLKPIAAGERGNELPFAVRMALGQAALDKAPVPSHLALTWVTLHPTTILRTPAVRCEEEFAKLFAHNYVQRFGEGLVVPKNRTKLKLAHHPASSGFNGEAQVANFGEIPDVSVLTSPIKKLQELVEQTTKDLDAFSRFVGKNPQARNSLEALLLLPGYLWPARAQSALQGLKARLGEGMVIMLFQELLDSLEAQSTLTKDKTVALARALETLHIGIEPDVLGGARVPKPEDKVVLFSMPAGMAESRATPTYQAALLSLQLASAVANADGDFCAKELSYLQAQVESWTHLALNHLRRLHAHLLLLHAAPASLSTLRSKLEPLDDGAKETIAAFMATVAQADGVVSPEEVKLLEKLYKALGIDPKRVFTDVHAAATGAQVAVPVAAQPERAGFKLDAARIAALQKDTDAVTALLSNIFKEEEPLVPAGVEDDAEAAFVVKDSLLGLDESHTVLARLLLSRREWTREELGDAAADLDLMVDGALEMLNDAAFDAHDIPFVEGDDPITVNSELMEKLAA